MRAKMKRRYPKYLWNLTGKKETLLCILELRLSLHPETSWKICLSRLFQESRLPSNGSFIRLAWNRPQSGSLVGRSFTKESRGEVWRTQGTPGAPQGAQGIVYTRSIRRTTRAARHSVRTGTLGSRRSWVASQT